MIDRNLARVFTTTTGEKAVELLVGGKSVYDIYGEKNADEIANEINAAYVERVRPLVQALESIIEHQKMVGGSISAYSTIYRIAKNALDEFHGQ